MGKVKDGDGEDATECFPGEVGELVVAHVHLLDLF